MDETHKKYVYTYKGKKFIHCIRVGQHPAKDFYLGLIDWIEENIKGSWTDFYNSKGHYIVEFELEEDAVAFKLRWM